MHFLLSGIAVIAGQRVQSGAGQRHTCQTVVTVQQITQAQEQELHGCTHDLLGIDNLWQQRRLKVIGEQTCASAEADVMAGL